MTKSIAAFDQLRHVSSYCALTFPRLANVAQHVDSCRRHLGSRFEVPRFTGVPDQFDPLVPRMIFPSTHGFSTIIISASTIGLQVAYSPDWQVDPEACQKHLKEAAKILVGLLPILEITRVLYEGVNLVYEHTAEPDLDPVAFLAERLLSNAAQTGMHDLQVRATTVIDGKYFKNAIFENYRIWSQAGLAPQFSVPAPIKHAQTRGIRLTIDFNDRFSFNESRAYSTNIGNEEAFIELSFAEAENSWSDISK